VPTSTSTTSTSLRLDAAASLVKNSGAGIRPSNGDTTSPAGPKSLTMAPVSPAFRAAK